MPFFKADDLQAWTGGKWSKLDPSRKPEIRGFSNDSRNIGKDFAFVAIKAERDGHDFAADAAANGATAIIAERELDVEIPTLVVKDSLKAFQRIAKMHRLRFEHPVVGITGSCGKTSTKEMLAKLTAWKNPLITEKNFNNEIGVPLTLTRIDLRQNQLAIVEAGVGAPDQMRELAAMIEPRHRHNHKRRAFAPRKVRAGRERRQGKGGSARARRRRRLVPDAPQPARLEGV